MSRSRHSRQVRLAEVGEEGQARLEATTAFVATAGLAGVVEARYLAGAGVGKVATADDAVADAARAIDPTVEIVAPGFAPPDLGTPPAFAIRDPAASEVVLGAWRALAHVRRNCHPEVGARVPLDGLMQAETKHPWVKGGVLVPRKVMDRVFDEARAAYGRDEEACGFLVGPASDPLAVTGAIAMENRANKLHKLDPETYPRTGRTYFDIDPLKFARAIEAGEAGGTPVKVLYHSHIDVGAYFSETDAAAAKMGGDEPSYDLAYLVVSVREGAVDDAKLFVWDAPAAGFVEGKLVLVE